ncbi:hypothetical protein INT43_004200 [Umbelopsis isabellina]|uniref:Pleckstrin homology domain-containing protein n=1 Tax=Mortierella isabellina TaxID=91625 RepID=A0A8H7PHL4_MORIS|nr:hypothetical protein INT43_004200 [Umbelopsis isabellina]
MSQESPTTPLPQTSSSTPVSQPATPKPLSSSVSLQTSSTPSVRTRRAQTPDKQQGPQASQSDTTQNILHKYANQSRAKEVDTQSSVDEEELPPATKEKLKSLERELNEYKSFAGIMGASPLKRPEKFMSRNSTGDPLPTPTSSTILPPPSTSSLLPPPPQSSTPTKRRSKVPNADRRNNDIEFATEIGQGLLLEVRKMQSLLQEKEEQLRALDREKAESERLAELLAKQLKQSQENEEHLKEDAWNLELAKQELGGNMAELQHSLSKSTADQNKMSKQLTTLTQEVEVLRSTEEKLSTQIETMKSRHEQDMNAMRKHSSSLQREKTEITKQLETTTAELVTIRSQSKAHRRSVDAENLAHGDGANNLGSGDENYAQKHGDSPNASPPPSPTHAPRNHALELETLKTSLGHAHRMISNLRSSLHKEKQDRFEMKKHLADSQETIEQLRNGSHMWADVGADRAGSGAVAGDGTVAGNAAAARRLKKAANKKRTPARKAKGLTPRRPSDTDGDEYEDVDEMEIIASDISDEDGFDNITDKPHTTTTRSDTGRRGRRLRKWEGASETSDSESVHTSDAQSSLDLSQGNFVPLSSELSGSKGYRSAVDIAVNTEPINIVSDIVEQEQKKPVMVDIGTNTDEISAPKVLSMDMGMNTEEFTSDITFVDASVNTEELTSDSVDASVNTEEPVSNIALVDASVNTDQLVSNIASVDTGVITEVYQPAENYNAGAALAGGAAGVVAGMVAEHELGQHESETVTPIAHVQKEAAAKTTEPAAMLPDATEVVTSLQKSGADRNVQLSRVHEDRHTDKSVASSLEAAQKVAPLPVDQATDTGPAVSELDNTDRTARQAQVSAERASAAAASAGITDIASQLHKTGDEIASQSNTSSQKEALSAIASSNLPRTVLSNNEEPANMADNEQKRGVANIDSKTSFAPPETSSQLASQSAFINHAEENGETGLATSKAGAANSDYFTQNAVDDTSFNPTHETAVQQHPTNEQIANNMPGVEHHNEKSDTQNKRDSKILAAAAVSGATAGIGMADSAEAHKMPAEHVVKADSRRKNEQDVGHATIYTTTYPSSQLTEQNLKVLSADPDSNGVPQQKEADVVSHSDAMSRRASSSIYKPISEKEGYTSSIAPNVVSNITQTMIGSWMWKSTRKTIGSGFSDNRHQRFFWIHPYSRTLYWSMNEPGTNGVAKAKSAYIESITAIQDRSSTSDLPSVSLLVKTNNREIKFTAQDIAQHEAWLQSINYLLSRPFNGTGSMMQSKKDVGSVRSIPSVAMRKPSSQRIHSVFSSSASNAPSRPDSHRYAGDGLNDEDLEDLEDVRMCCDGKHHLSKLEKHHSHRSSRYRPVSGTSFEHQHFAMSITSGNGSTH